jgi:phage virion morphogenesis protein
VTDARIELNDRRIEIELDRLKQLSRRDGARIMGAVARYMLTAMQMRFRTQVGTDGQPWWRSNRAAREGGQTLRDSNRLFRSLTRRSGVDYAEAGTNVVYAKVHHFGIREIVSIRAHRRMTRRSHGQRGAVSVRSSPVKAHVRLMFLPRRPFAGFGRADGPAILGILRRLIAEAAAK